ncbi:unnamed protein product [Rhizophagus irregularis]|uniref:Subtilisin-like protein n=1 Tax=Rhizophagus irregularis TaxID=588596 RepID=A0A2N1NNC5_9GLOM|nr:subtilisin-like protein [Rhizophagus irregularis]CAB4394737.1 unnamed protein product [Rhizophagus irregularis]CAB5365183.1 unnamed protein product [Rhizophagus irregularis]
MILPRPLIFLLLILSTLLLTSAFLCPNIPKDEVDTDLEQYIVYLKPPGLLDIVVDLVDHLLLLITCLGRTVQELIPGEGLFGDGPIDQNVITDLSFAGSGFRLYTGFFNPNFVETVLKKRNDVEFAEKILPVKADSAIPIYNLNLEKRTTQTSAPYNLDRIDQKNFPLDGSYSYPNDAGSKSNVYVVDTGIFVSNVEFEGRAIHGGTFCGNCSSTDDHGHGTNVAGVIGGKKFGVAKKTKLIAVKVLNQNGQGTSSTLVAGLSYVITKHKNGSNKNTIVNLSLSAPFSQAINQIVTDCINAGIHVVASAGDLGQNACNFSPSTVPQAITVGATEKTSNTVTSFSNTGECVTLYAPGRDIIAAGAGQNTFLSQASGTSQSCPHAAGAVALIISKNGNRSPSTMKNSLISLATKGILNKTPNVFLRVPTP